MNGIGLIFLILSLIAIFGGIYFAAWCLCAVQRNRKEGHYILEEVDDELYHKKLYSGLDTVDEAKETYVKNHLDLDDINENKHAEEEEEKLQQDDPEAPTVDSGDTAATDGSGNGEAELVSPSAPDDTNSHKSNDSPV